MLTVCRQTLPWDYFRVARDSGIIAKLIPCYSPSLENSLVARLRAIELFFLTFLPYGLENRLQEASVFIEGGFLVAGHCCFYGHRGGGRDDFKSTDKDTHDLSWCWIDRETQDVIDEITRHDVDQPTAFFEPGVLPCLYHCVGLVSI
jgi:hypothetical protein